MGLFSNFTPKDDIDHFRVKKSKLQKTPKYDKSEKISSNFNNNVEILKYLLHFPESSDVKFRFFEASINNKKYNSLIAFYDGLVDYKSIDDFIIKHLMSNKQVKINRQRKAS